MALFSQYAVAASAQAWDDAGLPEHLDAQQFSTDKYIDPDRVAIVVGNGIGGLEVFTDSHAKMLQDGPDRIPPMTIPLMIANEAAANIAMHFGVHGPAFTQVTACASGTDALGQALDLIRAERADIVIAGARRRPLPSLPSAHSVGSRRSRQPTMTGHSSPRGHSTAREMDS